MSTSSLAVRTVLCAAAAAVCWASDIAAAPTGQERAEAAGSGLLGAPAPALVVRTIDGHTIDLAELYSKQAVYLKFWATWCGPCRAQMPHFERTYETAGPGLPCSAWTRASTTRFRRCVTRSVSMALRCRR